MPSQCEICSKTTEDITDWFIVSVNFMLTTPSGERMLQGTSPNLMFDTLECRHTWCEKAGVLDPG